MGTRITISSGHQLRTHAGAALLALLVMSGACAPSVADMSELMDEAAACSEGDQCVFAGLSDCTCPAPVNSTRADEVEDTAKRVQCDGATHRCPQATVAHCDVPTGRCVATTQ